MMEIDSFKPLYIIVICGLFFSNCVIRKRKFTCEYQLLKNCSWRSSVTSFYTVSKSENGILFIRQYFDGQIPKKDSIFLMDSYSDTLIKDSSLKFQSIIFQFDSSFEVLYSKKIVKQYMYNLTIIETRNYELFVHSFDSIKNTIVLNESLIKPISVDKVIYYKNRIELGGYINNKDCKILINKLNGKDLFKLLKINKKYLKRITEMVD